MAMAKLFCDIHSASSGLCKIKKWSINIRIFHDCCYFFFGTYLFGKYAVIGAFDYFGIFIHIQSGIHFNGCWLTIIKIAIIWFCLTLWTLSLWTIRSLSKSKYPWKRISLCKRIYIKKGEFEIHYLLTFRILKRTQSNIAFIINGCCVWEFMCWKWNWCFGAIACVLKLSHNLTIQWASTHQKVTKNWWNT